MFYDDEFRHLCVKISPTKNTVDAFSILVTFTVRLLTNERPSLLILQNPPSTPTLLIGWLIAAINDIVLAIDWTNYGQGYDLPLFGGRVRI